ncbi:MAG: arginine--tRNA ligase [Paludibacteraceae bacterium]|nr:arginine--tRNA ligase [Paludibacteraceae bacterium]
MKLEIKIAEITTEALKALYNIDFNTTEIQLQKTKKEFEGDFTIVTFPFVKLARKSPEVIGNELGEYICKHESLIDKFNVIKGFLNISIDKSYWIQQLEIIEQNNTFGYQEVTENSPLVMVEYSSPNTNKPLHLGHIRNNLLGYSLSEILKANGFKVVKTNIVNDRGIHICKSMLAWQKFGNGATPQSIGKKGDHLVGDFYVKFDKEYKKQVDELKAQGQSEDDAKRNAPLMIEAQDMLRKWEANDNEVRALWNEMNSWVYDGFNETYKRLGIDFDKIYYESSTYLEGKSKVEEGLSKGIFYKKEDGSVWANLIDEGLDEKLLLRADGTSVYMTQDIGTAKLRFEDYPIDKMIYVVGNEQNYHFQVLSILLDKLGFSWGKDLVHFSYGMVELPEGKMKSREGTVVDADDLMDEMINTAKETSQELGKLNNQNESELNNIATIVGLGALKYFILKVDPRKNMLFDPKESIDFNGNTGPFIQYTHARIKSVLRKAEEQNINIATTIPATISISEKETGLIRQLSTFPEIVKQAGKEYSPSVIANYIYDLVKEYNQFYHDFSILKEENEDLRSFRLLLSKNVAKIISLGMNLLGIKVPERM